MEPIFEKILTELQALREGQARLESTQLQQGQELKALRKDVAEVKVELRYVWEDIKKRDKRLDAQGEELVILKRLK
ncbi:MAG: hypothetical protein QMC95_10190 [Desulfitobacteriaceae bacterium]|nr:hypothetical protein [Desulfitobacteriaceae bacterium]MDI6878307.1 hypothetical protein [Desulfitobacteriaceae bacterium]MDI6914579.1 hypothetical protein [Desulfitobacteriaceae bacterium]